MLYSYETAPFDDETEHRDEASISEAALEELARGKYISHDEVCRVIGQPSADMLAKLDTLDDRRLWQAAHRTLPQHAVRRLRALSQLQQQRALTTGEAQELAQLLDRLEDVGLVRAKAAVLLKARGHDVSHCCLVREQHLPSFANNLR